MFELIYNEGFYEYNGQKWARSSFEPEWMVKFLGKKPEIIFEFGSYDGGDGLRFKLAFPNANVFSFEPFPPLYPKVMRTQEYGVLTFSLAIMDYVGTMPFYSGFNKDTNEYHGVGSSLKVKETVKKQLPQMIYSDTPVYVPCTTIEQFCKTWEINNIDFMQIDVEGTADKVIKGFGPIRPKLIFVETWATENSHEGAATVEGIYKLLFDMNYELIAENSKDSLLRLKNG